MKNRCDLINENNRLRNINISNCIGSVRDTNKQIKKLKKKDKQIAFALSMVELYGDKLQGVQEDNMVINASCALLKQENERLKVKLNNKRLQ